VYGVKCFLKIIFGNSPQCLKVHSRYTAGMDNERIREICLGLPHVTETVNWGHHLVYWAGDRDLGGKMFAMTDLDGTGTGVLWFHCGAERFHELLERESIIPSPYLAKAHWVTLERWDALRPREIEEELRRAHALIFEKLSRKTKDLLAMPEKERKKLVSGRKKPLKGAPGASKSRGAAKKATDVKAVEVDEVQNQKRKSEVAKRWMAGK